MSDAASNRGISPLGAVVCFFRNHDTEIVYRDGAAVAWRCHRCHAYGTKLWMTGAWFVWWLRRGRRLGF